MTCKQDAVHDEDMGAIMRAEECSFMRGLEQSRPVLAAAPGAALAVPYTTRMQVGVVAQQMRCQLSTGSAIVAAMHQHAAASLGL